MKQLPGTLISNMRTHWVLKVGITLRYYQGWQILTMRDEDDSWVRDKYLSLAIQKISLNWLYRACLIGWSTKFAYNFLKIIYWAHLNQSIRIFKFDRKLIFWLGQWMDRWWSHSPDSAVELGLADGSAELDIFVGSYWNVPVGVELGGSLSVDMTLSFLLFIVVDLDQSKGTHCWAWGELSMTLLVGR